MLEFFRKYQKYFFIFITTIIVISFSFFGTYNSLPPDDSRELPAFRAVDGSYISRADLQDMVNFLSTDADDKLLFGGVWGPNFLNDGVIKKDLLQTGIAEILAAQFAADIAPDLDTRLANEKRFSLYAHPDAKFVSTEAVWGYYAPSMTTQFQTLQKASSPLDPTAFTARVNLYLGEKNFSPYTLKRVLHHQQSQYSWLTPDPNLERSDLSLFGYHTTEDWFGPRFMRIAAEFIINSAKIAQQRGYTVSKAEVLADLSQNANVSFKQNLNNPYLGVTSSTEYFNEQLRRMGIDQNRAIKIWQNVLLSRRLFQDAGHSVFTSPDLFAQFTHYAKESVQGDLYQLPKELKLADYQALQKFELYLNAIASRTEQEKTALTLPTKTLSVEEVAKHYPELVQKRYLLEVSQVNKNALLSKVGIKETYNWELEDANWTLLTKEFPDLGIKAGNSRSERYAALESINPKTRAKIDAFARSKILDAHPEWVQTALKAAVPVQSVVGIPLKGPIGSPFNDVKDPSTLSALLQQASENQQSAIEKLSLFTSDNQHYYAIRVIKHLPNDEILTFAEASRQGVLDRLLNQALQKHYLSIRESQPSKFRKGDNSWKELGDVKEEVANHYFANTLKAIQAQSNETSILTGNLAAPKRLLAHVNRIKNNLSTNPEQAKSEIKEAEQTTNAKLVAVPALTDQWKLEKQSFQIDRSSQHPLVKSGEALNLPLNAWSEVIQTPNGAIAFYQKLEVKDENATEIHKEKSRQARQLLSGEIQRLLATSLVTDFKNKDAISLSFMNNESEMIETE
ncbi:MAG: SurA N-terminal domain-containing protein [Parachlamydiaceae bacterium]